MIDGLNAFAAPYRKPAFAGIRRPACRLSLALGLGLGLGLAVAPSLAAPVLADTGRQEGPEMEPHHVAVLQGLDKVTARISELPVQVNDAVDFGALSITVRSCWKTTPLEAPESAAFLEITEDLAGAEPEVVFTGWMYASRPGVSALEHPVYDVWLVDCRNLSSADGDNSD